MINKILSALKAAGVSVYNIVDQTTESAEIYFIKKQEDMRRMKNIREITVTVYNDFEIGEKKMRGMSDIQIAPGMTEEEIHKKIAVAYDAAGYVKNPFFELADPVIDNAKAEMQPFLFPRRKSLPSWRMLSLRPISMRMHLSIPQRFLWKTLLSMFCPRVEQM